MEQKKITGEISAKELTKQMKIGWNLGNTLDALGADDLTAEMSWGNPKTSRENIDAVKAAGFNVLRVPVSWGPHLDEKCVIAPGWLDRVREVVDYGIDNDMFVILNTHHEEWYFPTSANLKRDTEKIGTLWTQIAESFECYGEKLIFEGVNEPRLRGCESEWSGTDEARAAVNKYNETFVKAVRASGGNNENRILMVTPYAASPEEQNINALEIPEDSGKIIVSVHEYLPKEFALEEGTSKYTENNPEVLSFFERVKSTFIDKEIHVIVGEFGAVNKDNIGDRIKFAREYTALGKKYGIPCVWWDNGQRTGSGENFALLDRCNNTWFFPELVEAIMKTAY